MSSLKVPRTEHVMSLIYGVPTIIGSTSYLLTLTCLSHLSPESQGEWMAPSSSPPWSSSTRAGTAGTFLSAGTGGSSTRWETLPSFQTTGKLSIKKHFQQACPCQVLTSPRYEHTVASIPASKVPTTTITTSLLGQQSTLPVLSSLTWFLPRCCPVEKRIMRWAGAGFIL